MRLLILYFVLGSLVACQPIRAPLVTDPTQAKIENATNAAPPTIAQGATIMD